MSIDTLLPKLTLKFTIVNILYFGFNVKKNIYLSNCSLDIGIYIFVKYKKCGLHLLGIFPPASIEVHNVYGHTCLMLFL